MPTEGPGDRPRGPAVSPGFLEKTAALLLLLWRGWTLPLRDVWKDWMALLAIAWILLCFTRSPKAALPITVAAAAVLLVLHASGQLPQTIALLRALR